MRAWTEFCGGLIAWTAHFFALYIIASLLPGQPAANWLVLGATLAAFVALGLMLRPMLRRRTDDLDGFDRWLANLGLMGIALSGVAIAYQGAIVLF
jgi:hypothetical protein